MADYLTRTLARAFNQFLLLFGGVLLLAVLLCAVASQIRGAGESALGRNYYYLVAPGVVCHETGHALGCLLTGTKIHHFSPFRPHGRELGSVTFYRKDGVWGHVSRFLIASGPIWFGCLVIIILTKLFARRCGGLMPAADPSGDFMLSSRSYWCGTIKAAGGMLCNVFRVWHWKSSLDVLYLYLIFCIASEMGLSDVDLDGTWIGMICICVAFLVLNVIPAVGICMSKLAFRACRWIFPIHVTMMFVLVLDFVFVLLFVWPIRFFFR